MALQLRYWGEFRSVQGDLYRIEILQKNEGIAFTPSRIGFAYDGAAVIEWADTDKLEPVQGSSLTLTLDSDTDRRFLDLYTIETGAIRADVYRCGELYWSGTLDPELYEEPYSEKQDYDVSVTFSDLAVLEREVWEGREIYSVRELIDRCLTTAGFNYSELVMHTSIALPPRADQLLTFDEVYIMGENFYDEDDEAITMREALDETLRPFALRLVQKCGKVYLYDLNALHAMPTKQVEWSDTDATLSADEVYNNVTVTFSPYASGELIDGELDPDEVLTEQPIGTSGRLIHTGEHPDYPEGFRIVTGAAPTLGNLTLSNGAVAYRIDPEYSGSRDAGVLWGYRVGEEVEWQHNAPHCPYGRAQTGMPYPATCAEIIRTPRTYIGTTGRGRNKHLLRVSLEVLFDARYNPFETGAHENKGNDYDYNKGVFTFGYIPMQLLCYDRNGVLVARWNNTATRERENNVDQSLSVWEPVTNNTLDIGAPSWLTYYDDDRMNDSGFGGWKTNRQTIGCFKGGLPSTFTVRDEGEYIPLPDNGCYIELRIYSGVDYFTSMLFLWARLGSFDYTRWLMYKNPKIEIVKANGRDVDQEDIEECAWINKSAKEDLEISTIFGTMENYVPSARGLLLNAEGYAYSTFMRAGHIDSLERLLIGTAYSQYASRKHVLSGCVELLPTFSPLTDRATNGCYILLGETQDLIQGESDIRMAQFDADNYTTIEDKL